MSRAKSIRSPRTPTALTKAQRAQRLRKALAAREAMARERKKFLGAVRDLTINPAVHDNKQHAGQRTSALKRSIKEAQEIIDCDKSPLDIMLEAMRIVAVTKGAMAAMDLAKEVAPYVHARLKVLNLKPPEDKSGMGLPTLVVHYTDGKDAVEISPAPPVNIERPEPEPSE